MNYGLYIHLPFCERKCSYCDFLSFSANEDLQKEYINALVCEIRSLAENEKKCVDTVFIGGGTPSCINEKYISKICEAVYQSFDISDKCEFSIEVNPSSASKEKLEIYKKSGINRVSVGIQSFDDECLKRLGRLHNSQEAEKCVWKVFDAGFENVNVDLMFAIPNQSKQSFESSIKKAISLPITHVSTYSLIIEPQTPFYDMFKKGIISEVSEDLYCDMCDLADITLKQYGFEKYEISNYAKKGYECKHNLKYWSLENYMAAGIGAVGFYGGARFENTKDIKEYISNNGRAVKKNVLTKEELISEYIICSLRKTEGFALDDFKCRFGSEFLDLYDITKYEKGGFLQIKNGRLSFTNSAMRVSNSILCDFV